MKIDILMAIYFKDRLEWIKDSVESTINSCGNYLKNFIVVLDGPIDQQIEDYLKNIKEAKIYKLNKNMGLSYALNYGLSFCSSRYVARMDADDICLPNRFNDQIKIIQESGCDILSGSVIEFDNNNLNYKKMIKKNLYLYNIINHPTIIFKKDKIISLGGYRHIKYFEDYDLWLRAKKNKLNFIFMQEYLVKMRFNNFSLKRRNGILHLIYEINALRIFFFINYLIPLRYLPFWLIRLFIRVLPLNVYSFIRRIIIK